MQRYALTDFEARHAAKPKGGLHSASPAYAKQPDMCLRIANTEILWNDSEPSTPNSFTFSATSQTHYASGRHMRVVTGGVNLMV